MNCTKAILPVAGYGTRRLPITKAIEKCMLPVLNRPIIDYVVQDCIKAGITDIYFVVNEGADQIRRYYAPAPQLEQYLQENKKSELVAAIRPPEEVRFHFVEQPITDGAPYGTAIPVWLCREFVQENEHVLVLGGDDFIYNADGSSEVSRLLQEVSVAGGGSALLGAQVAPEAVSRYGVIVSHEEADRRIFDYIQEKPAPGEAKSNLINISKYLLESSFFSYLDAVVQGGHTTNGEYYFTDALNAYVAAKNNMSVLPIRGAYLDGGSVENWLNANNVVAASQQS